MHHLKAFDQGLVLRLQIIVLFLADRYLLDQRLGHLLRHFFHLSQGLVFLLTCSLKF